MELIEKDGWGLCLYKKHSEISNEMRTNDVFLEEPDGKIHSGRE